MVECYRLIVNDSQIVVDGFCDFAVFARLLAMFRIAKVLNLQIITFSDASNNQIHILFIRF